MVRHLSELPVVRCPGCNRPMDAQERTSVTDRLVDIRYVCAVCGMETKRTVKEDD
jgi:DNA-directed RNA polymerase subunit RPC12/RpoP